MTISVLSLLLNLLIVGLLMTTISYCWVLNKRIKILQDSKSELANLLKYFDISTTRASESIVALQSASKKISENIQARTDKVNYLMDDLAFMIEKGTRLADKLDANFAINRAKNRIDTDQISPARTEAHDDIMEDFTDEIVEKPLVRPALKPVPVMERTEQKNTKEKAGVSLEAVLERVIGRVKSSSPKPAANNRSKAEQELLDMIRAGIKG
jgi:hypothetical protein